MNWLDIVIIVIALIGAYIGMKHGLIRTLFTVFGVIIGIVLAGQWQESIAKKLSSSGEQWAYILAFAAILVIVVVIANIAGKILSGVIKIIMLGSLDTLGGLVLGFLAGALIVAAILASLGSWAATAPLGVGAGLTGAIGDSALAKLLIDKFGLLLSLLPGKFDSVKVFFD